jgi:hypothetical protein
MPSRVKRGYEASSAHGSLRVYSQQGNIPMRELPNGSALSSYKPSQPAASQSSSSSKGKIGLKSINSLSIPKIDKVKSLSTPLSSVFSIPPSPIMTNTIRATAPVASSFYVIVLNSNKQQIGKSDLLSIPAGTSDITVETQLTPFERTGYFNIEPYNAPQGIVIESITTMPPTL